MKLYLLRHGQSTSDIEGRFGGDYDDSLTELGIKQAGELAAELEGKGIERIFTSPRKRAEESAAILYKTLRVPMEIVHDLRECNRYGKLTGMKVEEAKRLYPKQVALLNDYGTQLEGGESYEHFRERVLATFTKLSNTPYTTIAVVTHGGPIRCLYRELLKGGELSELGDCAVLELEASGGKTFVLTDKKRVKV